MALKSDAKFEEKLTCDVKNDIKNFENFYQSTRKSQIRILMGSSYPKQKMNKLAEKLCI